MCVGLWCDCLYRARCCFWKLLPILWIADLGLTISLVVGLYNADIFACCTHNWPGIGDDCGYEDLGGAANVIVDQYGYCSWRGRWMTARRTIRSHSTPDRCRA